MKNERLKKIVTSKAYALFVLLLISGWVHLIGLSVDKLGRTSISYTAIVIQLLAYLFAGIGVLANWSSCIKLWRKSWLWGLFVIFCCSSVLWTSDVFFTVSRIVGMLGIITIALLLACRLTVTEFLHWMVGFFLMLIILNYAFIYLYPQTSIKGRHWQGIFGNQNQLGVAMIIGVIVGYLQFVFRRLHLAVFLPLVLSAGLLIYYSSSITANLVLLTTCILVSVLFIYYKSHFSLYWLPIGLLISVSLCYLFNNELIDFLGKNSTLSGRTYIWQVYYEQVLNAPILGHGYSIGLDLQLVSDRFKYLVSRGAHNGYLEILFWFGWLGVAFLLFFLSDLIRKIYILLKNKYDKYSVIFLTAFVVMFLMVNLAESLILVRSGLFWTIFVFVIFKVNEVYDEFRKSVTS